MITKVVQKDQKDKATKQQSAGSLPRTGADSTAPLVQLGAALAAGGFVLTLIERNRRAARNKS